MIKAAPSTFFSFIPGGHLWTFWKRDGFWAYTGNSSRQGYKEIPVYPVLFLEPNTPPASPPVPGGFRGRDSTGRPRQGRAWPEDCTALASARGPGLPALLATSNNSSPRFLVKNKFGLLFLSFPFSWQSPMHPQKGHFYHYHQKRDEKKQATLKHQCSLCQKVAHGKNRSAQAAGGPCLRARELGTLFSVYKAW